MLVRESQPIPRRARLSDLLLDICSDISIRHDDPAYLETLCDDLIDDMIGESLSEENSILVRAIKLRKSLESSGLKLTQNLQKKVCTELQGYCDDTDDADDEAADGDDGAADEEDDEEDDDGEDVEEKTDM